MPHRAHAVQHARAREDTDKADRALAPDHRAVLALQRTAGNAATAALLAARRARSAPSTPGPPPAQAAPVQRAVSYRGAFTSTGTFTQMATLDADTESLIAEVDKKTDQARLQVINRPMFTGLDTLVQKDGHIALWVGNWRTAASSAFGRYPGSIASEYGYAVESLATHLLGSAAAGWNLIYQVAAGSTRPDIVAKRGTVTVWLDLTAGSTASSGHIYTSKGWNLFTICPYPHAEITYPPVNDGTQLTMLGNARLELAGTPPSATVDTAALEQKVTAATRLRKKRVKNWRERFGVDFGTKLKGVGKFRRSADPEKASRKGVLAHLSTVLKLTTALSDDNLEHQRLAASVLVVLKRSPKTYGLHTVTASRSAGIAFLEQHDKNLLT